jgi:hypothetical protein
VCHVARSVLFPSGIPIYGTYGPNGKIALWVRNDDPPSQRTVNKLVMRPGNRHEIETLSFQSTDNITAVP